MTAGKRMFYDPRDNLRPAPLGHNPLNALVAPRPIGWIATVSGNGEANLAPFSYFNAFSADPPLVGFAPNALTPGPAVEEGQPKDTLANVRAVGEFTVSMVSAGFAEQMNETSRAIPHGKSEFEAAGLRPAASALVRPPRVEGAKAALECQVFQIITLPTRPGGRGSHLILGEVIGIHIDDDLIVHGRVDSRALALVCRLGYFDYAIADEIFEMLRPE